MRMIANSQESLQRALGDIRQEWARSRYLRIEVRAGRSRSLKQNNHSHAWYEQLARELPEFDALRWKCFCKLHFGVPLMRAEESDFREMYDLKLKGFPYETKLLLMEWVPVTSLMTKKQLQTYETAMQTHFLEHGVSLEYPNDERAAA